MYYYTVSLHVLLVHAHICSTCDMRVSGFSIALYHTLCITSKQNRITSVNLVEKTCSKTTKANSAGPVYLLLLLRNNIMQQ